MSKILIFNSSDEAIITFDWSADVLVGNQTIASATHSVDSPLVKVSEDNTTTTSSVKISGASHGAMYMVSGQVTLSNGEILNRPFDIRGWNS